MQQNEQSLEYYGDRAAGGQGRSRETCDSQSALTNMLQLLFQHEPDKLHDMRSVVMVSVLLELEYADSACDAFAAYV